MPEVLRSGNHAQIEQWRHRRALEKTWRRRPELLEDQALSQEDRRLLEEIKLEARVAAGTRSVF